MGQLKMGDMGSEFIVCPVCGLSMCTDLAPGSGIRTSRTGEVLHVILVQFALCILVVYRNSATSILSRSGVDLKENV